MRHKRRATAARDREERPKGAMHLVGNSVGANLYRKHPAVMLPNERGVHLAWPTNVADECAEAL